MRSITQRSTRVALVAGTTALALLAGACGGGGDSSSSGSGDDSGTADGKPQRGGTLSYGLEAENSGGWCLPEGQLAISGIMVARAIYDTLTVPNDKGEYVPYLAESVTPNADYTQWTIKLRPGVKFHDGSPLTAQVVKNNLDAFRGQYPGRTALLMQFVFQNVASVDVVDDTSLTVTTKTPWPAFPAYLFNSGRAGIMAQSQLDSEECDSKLVGTGPFKLKEWSVNDHLTAERNADYWQKDADGNQLPYLDEVVFRPVVEGSSRTSSLQSGQLNAMHTSGPAEIEALRQAKDAGEVSLIESDQGAEVAYGLLNTSKPPFDNQTARQAAAYALDREQINDVVNRGITKIASGPFGPGQMGFLKDSGFPSHNLDKAKELVAQYQKETGQPLEFTLTLQNTQDVINLGQLLKEQAAKVGVTVNLKPVEQATLISQAIAGDFQALSFRNHPGGDPDTQYVWWHSGLPTNFGRIKDPEMDALLDQGRAESDPAKRTEIYEKVNKLFAEKVYNLWVNWVQWDVATAPEVHDIIGSRLPDGSKPSEVLANGHSVTEAWIQK